MLLDSASIAAGQRVICDANGNLVGSDNRKRWHYLDGTVPTGASASTEYWQFDTTANRLVGRQNGNHFSVNAGTVIPICRDGLDGIFLDGSTQLVTANANLNSIAAITVEMLLAISRRNPSAIQLLFLHEPVSPDETEAKNVTYLCNLITDSHNLSLNQEGGAGVNDSNNATSAVLPPVEVVYLAYTRASNGTTRKLYIQGVQSGATSTATLAPTGGGSGVFQIGYSGGVGLYGAVFSARVSVGQEWSSTQIAEVYARLLRAS